MSSEPILLYSFYSISEASIFSGMLKRDGIFNQIINENINSIYPLSNLANGGINILVHPKDFEAAKKLLDEFLRGENEEETAAPLIMCVNCGSFNVLQIPVDTFQYYEEFRCFDCDAEWDNRSEKNINPGVWE
ncbi:MAG TPA: hypothetical protein VIL57_08080 [Bacteroidia bacterium]